MMLAQYDRELNHFYDELRTRVVPFCLVPNGEVRDLCIGNLLESALICSVALRLYQTLCGTVGDSRRLVEGLGYPDIDSVRVVGALIGTARRVFMLNTHYWLEILFCRLANKLDGKNHRKLEPAAAVLLAVAHPAISKRDLQRKTSPLAVATAIRNSMHNNGVHGNKTLQRTVAGKTYKFTKGRVTYEDFPEYLEMMHHTIGILEVVLSVPHIVRLRVMDKFALERGIALRDEQARLNAIGR